MIKITGSTSFKISKRDIRIIREYTKYVLGRFVTPSVLKKSRIIINITHQKDVKDSKEKKDLSKFSAWCIYEGIVSRKRQFNITLSSHRINRRSKNQLTKLKNLLMDLGHELVHVKQYLNNESFDYVNGDTRFKGKIFSNWEEGENYYFSPWEIEAYGYAQGLYVCFLEKFKD